MPPPRGFVLVLGVLTALGPLSIDAYLPALPTLERELGVPFGAGAVTLSAYFLGLAGTQLPFGVLADRVGRRPPLVGGLLLYALGSIACALAPSLPILAAARLAQGVGAAASMVVTRTLVRDLWSGREVARVLSLMTLVMGAAPVLAPLAGGALLAVAGWRSIFGLLAVVGVVFAVMSALVVPETLSGEAPEPIGRGLREMLRDRRFVSFSLASAAGSAGMFAYISGSPDVFMRQLGASTLLYALCFGANAFALVSASQVNRAMLAHRSSEAMGAAGVTGLVLSGGGLVATALLGPGLVPVEALLFLFLAAQGLVLPNTVALALEHQARRAGLASAVLGTVQFAISAMGSGAIAALADGTMRPMAAVMAGCAVAAAVALGIGVRSRRPAEV
jgi:DHA1 family bicyclomycin/chloramphenicol resistance-like MFS transporter